MIVTLIREPGLSRHHVSQIRGSHRGYAENIVPRRLQGALNWVPIMPQEGSLSFRRYSPFTFEATELH